MSIERIRELNGNVKIYSVSDDEFAEYGKIITDMDITDLRRAAESILMPAAGSVYNVSEASFEALPIAKEIEERIFGTLPIQLGSCCGFGDTLNATEWHACPELDIMFTPIVFILGKRSDIKNGRLNSADMKAFYIPAGTVIEVFDTTLHYSPCQVDDGGFRCAVGLPRGTNTPLEHPVKDTYLFRRNKWVMAHEDNKSLISRGAVSGIYGENYKIKFK